jgi:hypothetical protein
LIAGKALTEVITLANQRIAARESKKIEQQGGQLSSFINSIFSAPVSTIDH